MIKLRKCSGATVPLSAHIAHLQRIHQLRAVDAISLGELVGENLFQHN